VLRLPLGGAFLVFNGRDGEWLCHLQRADKKGGQALCFSQERPQALLPELSLLFAPIKGDRTDYVVEKATELGVTRLVPILTARTIVRKPNLDRLRARAVEAAEQCERLCVPMLSEPCSLDRLYESPNGDGVILFADEAGDAPTIAGAMGDTQAPPSALLIGPEGGFTPEERARLRQLPHVRPVSLGPHILRADTAAIAGLVLMSALRVHLK
jgi:16S rRNA (uracil1498-N3)-methyltransferase